VIGFDWYQATVPKPVDDVLEALAGLSHGLQISHARGHHGYAHAALLGNEREGTVATVWHGGSHEYPHAVVTGEWAQPGAELIRAAFPVHMVSRMDVREDFGGEGTYDRLQGELLSVARVNRLQVSCAGDHLLTREGRTVYLGSPKSAFRLRMYDKAAELRARLARPSDAALLGYPAHLTRLEAQLRMQRPAAKLAAATMEPVQALGCSAWMRQVWKAVAQLDLEPVQLGKLWRPADDERAYTYLLAQYGGLLRRMCADLGSWQCVGMQIGDDLAGKS
jgi:hypothetical protein